MKTALSAFAVLFVSTLAQASPLVGDSATYSQKVEAQPGQVVEAVVSRTLTQFDAAKNAYLEVDTTTVTGGTPQTEQSWTEAANFIKDETVAKVLADCPAAGGATETVQVPAGSFNTCRFSGQSGVIVNVGAVPFGLVKGIDSSSHLEMQLLSFKAGAAVPAAQ